MDKRIGASAPIALHALPNAEYQGEWGVGLKGVEIVSAATDPVASIDAQRSFSTFYQVGGVLTTGVFDSVESAYDENPLHHADQAAAARVVMDGQRCIFTERLQRNAPVAVVEQDPGCLGLSFLADAALHLGHGLPTFFRVKA